MIFVGIYYFIYDNWIYLNVKWYLWMKYIEWFYVIFCFYVVYYIEIGFNIKNLGVLFIIFD